MQIQWLICPGFTNRLPMHYALNAIGRFNDALPKMIIAQTWRAFRVAQVISRQPLGGNSPWCRPHPLQTTKSRHYVINICLQHRFSSAEYSPVRNPFHRFSIASGSVNKWINNLVLEFRDKWTGTIRTTSSCRIICHVDYCNVLQRKQCRNIHRSRTQKELCTFCSAVCYNEVLGSLYPLQ